MSTATLLTLAGAFAAALVVNAALLWLTCRWLDVRHPATPDRRGVTFRRASTLAACSLTATLLAGAACWTLCVDPLLALNAHAALSLAASVVLLRFGLPVGWGKAIGVEAVWTTAGVPFAFVGTLLFFNPFVEPGAEMADVIRGPHGEVVCPQCRHAFRINARNDGVFDEDGCTCPNCRLTIPFAPAGMPAPPGFVNEPEFRRPDRVLLPGLLLAPNNAALERFDVVALDRLPDFRFPPSASPRGFLRVVGMPGEAIALRQGDLYVCRSEQSGETDEAWHNRFWQQARIVRKPPAKVLATMRLVYDSRHPAADLTTPAQRRWAEDGDNGWRKAGIGFRHDGGNRDDAWLRYRHVLRPHNFAPSLVTDFDSNYCVKRHGVEHWVGDLILECDADVGEAGEWALELSRGPDRFQARFDLAAGSCALLRLAPGKRPETLAMTTVKVPARAHVRFANVDHRLIVWVNDRLPFGEGIAYDGPNAGPVKETDLDRPASMGVKGSAVSVRRLRLLRDVHYADERDHHGVAHDDPFHPADPATWNQFRPTYMPYATGANHYFLVGDDSLSEADSLERGGFARGRILGKALLRFAPLSRVGRVE